MRDYDERLNIRISAYLDGEMSEEERREFERFLENNPDADALTRRLRNQKKLLEKKESLQENPWFWSRLSLALPRESGRRRAWNRFPRFAVATVFVLTTLVVAATGYLAIEKPFRAGPSAERSRNAGENTTNAIVPVFSSLNTDDVLRFALSGAVPLGKESNTVLAVERKDGEKYDLNLIRSRKRKPAAAVTAEQFYREINATPAQHRRIDSLLEEARKQLETSIFLAENNTLAIRPRLVGLNREMVVGISRSLQPAQVRRFNRLLRRLNSPQYVAVSGQYGRFAKEPEHPSWGEEPEDHFLVITPAMRGARRLRIVPEQVSSRTRVEPVEVVERRLRLLFEGGAGHELPGGGEWKADSGPKTFSVSVSSDGGTLRISIERGSDGAATIRSGAPEGSRPRHPGKEEGTVPERMHRPTRGMEDAFLKFQAEKESLLRHLERQQRYLDSLIESLPEGRRARWRFFFKIDSVAFLPHGHRRGPQFPAHAHSLAPLPNGSIDI